MLSAMFPYAVRITAISGHSHSEGWELTLVQKSIVFICEYGDSANSPESELSLISGKGQGSFTICSFP